MTLLLPIEIRNDAKNQHTSPSLSMPQFSGHGEIRQSIALRQQRHITAAIS